MPLFNSKTDWVKSDIVQPEDVNRWEQGIVDINSDLDLHKMSADHDEHNIPLILQNQTTRFSVNSGNINANGDADILNAPGSGTVIEYSTLPTYASASEAVAGKNGISVSDGSNYALMGLTSGSIDANVSLDIVFTLDNPSVLYAFDFTAENHANWFGPCGSVALYGSNDNKVTWTPLVHDFTVTGQRSAPYLGWLDYNNQAVSGTTAYKNIRLVASGGQSGFNLYFKRTVSVSSAKTLYLKAEDTYPQLKFTNAQGTQTTLETAKSLDMSGYANGLYNIFLKTDGTIEALANAIYRQAGKPTQVANKANYSNTGCTITADKIATGGAGKLLSLPFVLPLATANSWEFRTKYTPNGGGTEGEHPFGKSGANFGTPVLKINTNRTVALVVSSDGVSWNLVITSTATVTNGVPHYFKFGFNSTTGYYIKVGTAGWDGAFTDFCLNPSTTKCVCNSVHLLLNDSYNTTTCASYGSMDLKETSVSINGATYWQAHNAILADDVWFDFINKKASKAGNDGLFATEYLGTPIGTSTVSSGLIQSVTTNPYNQNGYDINSLSYTSKLDASGYTKLPNGLILQWGRLAIANADSYNIQFPIAFPNAVVSILGGWVGADSVVGVLGNATRTNSGFTGNMSGSGAGTAEYIAIGY